MTTSAATVRIERHIPAAPHWVYRAWLDPDVIRQWLAPGDLTVARVDVDEKRGGRYRVWQQDADAVIGGFECEILELVADQLLRFRWGFAGPDMSSGPVFDSVLTITLEPASDGGTHLTLLHEKLDSLAAALPDVARNVGPGWNAVIDELHALSARPANLTEHQ